jgi:hypothetical protein
MFMFVHDFAPLRFFQLSLWIGQTFHLVLQNYLSLSIYIYICIYIYYCRFLGDTAQGIKPRNSLNMNNPRSDYSTVLLHGDQVENDYSFSF